jgi:hypothetical protein
MNGLATAHDAAMQMIDTSVVRVHQHGACIAENHEQHIGRSHGGLTNKVRVVVDANGLPVRLGVTPGRGSRQSALFGASRPQTILLADRGDDADWIRQFVPEQGIPPKKPHEPHQLQPRSLPLNHVTWSLARSPILVNRTSAGPTRPPFLSRPALSSRSRSWQAGSAPCRGARWAPW